MIKADKPVSTNLEHFQPSSFSIDSSLRTSIRLVNVFMKSTFFFDNLCNQHQFVKSLWLQDHLNSFNASVLTFRFLAKKFLVHSGSNSLNNFVIKSTTVAAVLSLNDDFVNE